MSIVRLLGTSALCVGMLTMAAPVMAQDAPVEVSAGYNYLRLTDDEGVNVPKGWYADVAGNVTDMLGIVGQVTGNYKTEEALGLEASFKLHTYMAGLRVSGASASVRPFGQVLLGLSNASFTSDFGDDESSNDAALQIGGGINLTPGGPVGVRVGADYLRIFSDEGTNAIRFNVGVTFGR